ncbi:MAG: TfoX/Sxy family protein [Deltaproteobacteria bacterium]|nr:TfoX/Sxy family protein [Deltaproteobacteria bacterium]
MAAGESYRDFVLDQLGLLGGATARAMFGGYGLYHDGLFFGLIWKERLYFRTGPETRPRYESAGMEPFSPGGKVALRNYYEVPADIIEDSKELAAWARLALDASVAAASAPKCRPARLRPRPGAPRRRSGRGARR